MIIIKDLKINDGKMDFKFNLENSLVFDVGLNVGNKSEYFLLQGARVVGFEPQEECFNKAIERLSKYPKFIGENIALSNEEGLSEIYISDSNTLTTMCEDFIEKTRNNRFYGVSWPTFPNPIYTTTLDKMILKYGKPEYIKIDVEGYEYQVLQGLTQKIKYISIEFVSELYHNSEKCIDYLYNLSNQNCDFNYVYRENDHYYFKDWISIDEIKSYLINVNDPIYEFGDIFIRMNNV